MGKLLKHVNKTCELESEQDFLKRKQGSSAWLKKTTRLWWIPRDESGSNQSAVVLSQGRRRW